MSIFLLQRIRQYDVNEIGVFRNCFEGFGELNKTHLELRLCLHIFLFLVLRLAFVPGLPFQVRYIFPITKLYLYAAPFLLPNPSNRPKESHGPYIHRLPLNALGTVAFLPIKKYYSFETTFITFPPPMKKVRAIFWANFTTLGII